MCASNSGWIGQWGTFFPGSFIFASALWSKIGRYSQCSCTTIYSNEAVYITPLLNATDIGHLQHRPVNFLRHPVSFSAGRTRLRAHRRQMARSQAREVRYDAVSSAADGAVAGTVRRGVLDGNNDVCTCGKRAFGRGSQLSLVAVAQPRPNRRD